MKRFFTSLLVAALCFAVSCGGSSSEKKEVIEETSKSVSAEEGGEITVAGGTAKIKIPAGDLQKTPKFR